MEKIDYPISKSGHQCISKCYQSKIKIQHPITTEFITNKNAPFCAINPIYDGQKVLKIMECDEVDEVDKNINIDDNSLIILDKKANLEIPLQMFDASSFLHNYYGIKNINDFNNWIYDNHLTPIFTRIRIIDCFLKVFGKNIILFDDIFINAIYTLIKQFWIKKIYGKLHKYIGIKKNNECVMIQPNKNTLGKMDNYEIRSKYIINKIITNDKLIEISNKYIETSKKSNLSTDAYLEFIIRALEKDIITNITTK